MDSIQNTLVNLDITSGINSQLICSAYKMEKRILNENSINIEIQIYQIIRFWNES